jgi:sporulation protein YlmC with PRC-barrel domain
MVDATTLTGKNIVSAKGETLGEVNGVDVDLTNWHVSGLYVSLTNDATIELGFKKPFLSKVVICLPINVISSVGDVITMNEAVKALRDVVERLQK